GCMVSSTPYPTGCYPPPVDLAVVPTEVRPLPEAWMKIRIDTGHIKVDVDTSRLALTSADPSNLFRSQPIPLHQGTIGEADLNMSLITPLYDLLHTHIKTVRQFSACFVRPDLDTSMVVFEIAPDVPYGTVARAVYTAGQAQFSTFVFAVEGPNGAVGALHVDAPKIIAGVRKANRPEPQALCIQPSTTVGREGVQMRAHERPWDGALIAKAYRPDKTRIAAELFQGDTPSRLSELLGGSGGLGGAQWWTTPCQTVPSTHRHRLQYPIRALFTGPHPSHPAVELRIPALGFLRIVRRSCRWMPCGSTWSGSRG
ncbi:MAG: hypothetical protein AAFS10_15785, partial [Myxococcota bacterium]